MLLIPQEIMDLYHTDSVYKNLRIHFPNEELDDITNENVLYESLSLKESICSQDSFKFGLCEASEISFETVGIPNMIDMEIEVYIEIDVSSLTKEDGTNDFSGHYESDSKPIVKTAEETENTVYAIPLGTFVISSCPRSQSDMTHRQVTAYTKTFNTNDDMGVFPNWLISQLHKTKKIEKDGTVSDETGTFTMYLPAFADMCVNRTNWEQDYIAGPPHEGGTPFNLNNMAKGDNSCNRTKFYLGHNVYLFAGGTMTVLAKNDELEEYDNWEWKSPLVYTTNRPADVTYEVFENAVVTLCKQAFQVFPDGWEPDRDVIKDFYDNYLYGLFVAYSAKVYTFVKHDGSNRPFCIYDEGLASVGQIQFPTKIYVAAPTSDDLLCFTANRVCLSHSVTPLNGNKLRPLSINIDSNLTVEDKPKYRFSFYNSFTFKEIMTSYLELNALFGNQERDGLYTWFRISKSGQDHVDVDADTYKTIWYDEYDVDNIGHVLYQYEDVENNTNEINYSLTTGETEETATSIYDMRDNKVIELLTIEDPTKTQKLIGKILDKMFAPYVSVVKFTPIDFELIGLPYMEDGDYITIHPSSRHGDTDTVESFVLSRTMNGIQTLTDSIVSQSGNIISDDEYTEPEDEE